MSYVDAALARALEANSASLRAEREAAMPDLVNHPPHYKRGDGTIECIEAIEAMTHGWSAGTSYRLGNVLKYLWRHRDKAPLASLKKARWYLDREINALERDG